MLTDGQIKEIRNFLEKAKKPLFFFDDDPDGLTSYLLLKKKYKKGIGLCVKPSPKSEIVFSAGFRKHKPDLVVLLDKPTMSQDILDEFNVPVVWLDHHKPVKMEGVNYYNPMNGDDPDNRPTSYWAYRVADENEWVAIIGIIGDWHVPEKKLINNFKYAKLLGNAKTAPEMRFDTEYGKLVKIFSFAIKGSNDSMNECINALEKINDPMEILEQSSTNGKIVFEKFDRVNKEYELLLKDAMGHAEKGEFYVYTYVEDKNSFTSNLADELLHRLDNEVFIIGREKDGDVRMSIRSRKKPVRPVLERALKHVEGYGGGHALACGASVKMHDFPRFVGILKEEYKKEKSV